MSKLNNLLDWGLISRLRRNHALEHATLNILSRQNPTLKIAGYSDLRGFWLVGDISTEDLQIAVDEGLQRLQKGESSLAIHPNCGTNFVVSGVIAGGAGWLGMLGVGNGFRKYINRLPVVITLVTLALVFSNPIGPAIQERFTTAADLAELKIMEITRYYRRGIPMHRVVTKN